MITSEILSAAFKGFKTLYTDAYNKAPVYYDKIAMTVPSSGRDETYGWLGQFPQLREWLDGDRVVKELGEHGFTIANRKFESTIEVARDDFDDDKLGIFKPQMTEMGHRARQHPDELIFELLPTGFTSLCYDGQNFFDADHPTPDKDGTLVTVSNMQAGTGPTWYLFDTTRTIKPIIWQERAKYEFTQVTDKNDLGVFMSDKYYYGIRARVNAGFGLWQLVYASKAPLTAANYQAARTAMMQLRGDQGRMLGINPSTLVAPAALEGDARRLMNSEFIESGVSNAWKGTADLIVTPYLNG